MDKRRWIEYGKQIGRAGNGTSWWLGDWLRYGNARFGEKYTLAARITGYDEQTLMNYVYVASHVPAPQRRPDISWSHHAEVAGLERGEQAEWLDRIASNRMSVKDLRRSLRSAHTTVATTVTERPAISRAQVCPACGRPLARTSADNAAALSVAAQSRGRNE
jgi:hypothetical protein